MAEAITIGCPECKKKITVAAAAVGKKVRCKGCDHVFVVKAPAAPKAAVKPTAKPAAKAAAAKKKPPEVKAAKPKDDEEEEDSNPYGVTSEDTTPRCPECANEMEGEDAIICLTCGYNTRTRTRVETRAVEDVTGMIVFLWLLPGILCVLGILSLLTFDILYTIKGQDWVEGEWYEFLGSQAVMIWTWVGSLFAMYPLGYFAVKRLILHPQPPDRVKKKAKKEDD